MNAHSVYAQWPPTAEHCRIIQSSVEVLQACGPGQYSEVVDNKQTCRECPPGSFSEAGDNDFADEAACTPCPAGTFASEPGSVVCVSCDAKGAYFQVRQPQCNDGHLVRSSVVCMIQEHLWVCTTKDCPIVVCLRVCDMPQKRYHTPPEVWVAGVKPDRTVVLLCWPER